MTGREVNGRASERDFEVGSSKLMVVGRRAPWMPCRNQGSMLYGRNDAEEEMARRVQREESR